MHFVIRSQRVAFAGVFASTTPRRVDVVVVVTARRTELGDDSDLVITTVVTLLISLNREIATEHTCWSPGHHHCLIIPTSSSHLFVLNLSSSTCNLPTRPAY